ncbi:MULTISPECIES: NAD-dependent epimerase/dehydratase family protein [unclassified Aurantimonas]|uniref:NAD-dependent epimerase/dehydratase family protein n=1 Tax=unclassified Aurantimonas TaxID=2638230 RepID=UPI002E172269|nr:MULTISPECIES: NAD-dependent epimerase/dehydratase family protein [unclassified Aurantimonas]MEC5293822.1 NAD-dependent epimerase/dehydratase family protein [Aurantimonas sp. C2-3-R2]MEC5414880.1 NAD-dependent epimerase/dehydratase family protein [Aurantimonas sp. C2-4-R8]
MKPEMTKTRILISGATGFIGRQLAVRLLAAGYHISALYRNDRSERPQAISWIRTGDLATTPIDPAIGQGIDVFINLAATVRPTSGEPSGSQSQTAAIARNVSRFVSDARIPRVLILSSVAASLAKRDPTHARHYGVEKLAADRIFLERPGDGHRVVVLRPPAVYGKGMQNSMTTLAGMVRKGLPIPLGCAAEPRHYISVHNLCDLIGTIVGSDDGRWAAAAGHVFEPSDGQAVATRDLIRMMGDAMGHRARLLPVPLGLLRALGAVTGRAELISGAIDRLDLAPVEELETAFGWRPVERMPESLAFLRDEVSSS